MTDVEGRVAVVTGAGSGIGREIAINLASKGVQPVITDINREGLAETEKLIAASSAVRVLNRVVDVTDLASMESLASEVERELGKCDFLFNNAGIYVSGRFGEHDYAVVYKKQIDINVYGVIHGSLAFRDLINRSDMGRIANVSSTAGQVALPYYTGYNLSKFAVRGFTEALRAEYDLEGNSTKVCGIYPGGVKTNISSQGRLSGSKAAAEALESALVLSASDAAAVIVDGVLAGEREILVGDDAKLLVGMLRTHTQEQIVAQLLEMGVVQKL